MSLTVHTLRTIGRMTPGWLLRPLGQPMAVFFHGVEQQIPDPALQENHHAIEDFHTIAAGLKTHFEVRPLSDLEDALSRPQRHRRTVFLMSDDGYANTLHIAAGVLQDLELPWTLFVSTEHIDGGEPNPMFTAGLFFRAAPDGIYDLPNIPEPVRLDGSRAPAAAQMRERFRFLPARQARETVLAMQEILGRCDYPPPPRSECFLDWDGVRALNARGVTIGAHAHWHWALHGNEDPDFLRLQAELPKQRIEAELGVACRYFAYPFGNTRDVSRAAWQAVRDTGYDYAFTTLGGTLKGSMNPWLLPRYGLAPQEPNLFGMLPLLRTGNRRVARWQRTLA